MPKQLEQFTERYSWCEENVEIELVTETQSWRSSCQEAENADMNFNLSSVLSATYNNLDKSFRTVFNNENSESQIRRFGLHWQWRIKEMALQYNGKTAIILV